MFLHKNIVVSLLAGALHLQADALQQTGLLLQLLARLLLPQLPRVAQVVLLLVGGGAGLLGLQRGQALGVLLLQLHDLQGVLVVVLLPLEGGALGLADGEVAGVLGLPPPGIHVDLEDAEALVELVDGEEEVGEDDGGDEDDVGEQDAGDVGAGGDFLADAHVQLHDVPVQVEHDDDALDADVEVVEEVVPEGPEAEQVDQVDHLEDDVGDLRRGRRDEDQGDELEHRVDELVVPLHLALGVDAQVEALEELEVRGLHVVGPLLVVLARLRVHREVGHVQVPHQDHPIKVHQHVLYCVVLRVRLLPDRVQDVGCRREDGDAHDLPCDDAQLVSQVVVHVVAQPRPLRHPAQRRPAHQADQEGEEDEQMRGQDVEQLGGGVALEHVHVHEQEVGQLVVQGREQRGLQRNVDVDGQEVEGIEPDGRRVGQEVDQHAHHQGQHVQCLGKVLELVVGGFLADGLQHVLRGVARPVSPQQERVQVQAPVHDVQGLREHHHVLLGQVAGGVHDALRDALDHVGLGTHVLQHRVADGDLIEEQLELRQGQGLREGQVQQQRLIGDDLQFGLDLLLRPGRQ